MRANWIDTLSLISEGKAILCRVEADTPMKVAEFRSQCILVD
jgi:hypothetical protein